MRRIAALAFLLASLSTAGAQAPPFDMSPEREALPGASGGATPVPRVPDGDSLFGGIFDEGGTRRYLLPEATIRLQGETALREWAFHLTPEQAATDAQLVIGYVNAVVVAPEASMLSIVVNDATVLQEPQHGAEYVQRRAVKIPAGVLRPGSNRIRISASQRHRTDCSIDSTYELWTDIDAEQTYLSFAAPNANRMTRLSDIETIGVDPQGRNRFTIVAPSLESKTTGSALLRLSQALAVMSGAPNASFSFSRDLPDAPQPGEFVALVGTTAEMRDLAGPNILPTGADRLIGFVPMPGHPEATALAVIAPDWNGVETLAGSLASLSEQDGVETKPIDSSMASLALTPFLNGSERLSFSELGVSAQKFSGRRFSTSFAVGLPADFYAGAYGTATILLDAAYASEVRPGSSMNVSVNGRLATTVPITSSGGAVLQKYPIRLTMRHFRPGINTITFEVLLQTESDRACAPGATADEKPRFALFGTSELVMPNFARAERAPHLAATAALAFPYRDSGRPMAVVLGRNDELTLSAAATVLGKLALAAGRNLDLRLAPSANRTGETDSLVVGAADDLPAETLGRIVLPTATEQEGGIERLDDANLEFWQDRVDPGAFWNWLSARREWLKETFDLDLSMSGLWPGANGVYHIPGTTDVFVQQSVEAGGDAVRTVVSAASRVQLANGAEALALKRNWLALDGRIATHDTVDDTIGTVEDSAARFLSLRPLTLTNLRLVLTNWLSQNFLLYTIILLSSAVALGLATNALLSRIGRNRVTHRPNQP